MEILKNYCFWSHKSQTSWMVTDVTDSDVTVLELTNTVDKTSATYPLDKFEQAIKDLTIKMYDQQNEWVKAMRK